MKIRKYLFIIIILLILMNISCITAADNSTDAMEMKHQSQIVIDECDSNTYDYSENPKDITGSIDDAISADDEQNFINTYDDIENADASDFNNKITLWENKTDITNNNITTAVKDENSIASNHKNQKSHGALTQSYADETLSEFIPFSKTISIDVNDTSSFEETENVTIKIHFSFITPFYDGEFPSYNISIYENNTLIQKLNIGELNLPEVVADVTYEADITFDYHVHDNCFLTASLFDIYSDPILFEKKENQSLQNGTVTIDDKYQIKITNNSLESVQNALNLAKNNGTIQLNNIDILQDINETIEIDKNITIIANNSKFLLNGLKTLFEISQNAEARFIGLTFSGDSNYTISNKGKLELINCTFTNNNLGMINNSGDLKLIGCRFEEYAQYYNQSILELDGLIINNGTLNITDALFNNSYKLPYHVQPIDSVNLKGIIYNNGNLTIDNANFTNINTKIIYNNAELRLNNTLFENISAAPGNSVYPVLSQELNSIYSYKTYQIKTNSKTIDGVAIFNNKKTLISNSKFNNIEGNNGGIIYNNREIRIDNSMFANIKGYLLYNNGTLSINKTAIQGCDRIYNNHITNITHSQITGSTGIADNYGILSIDNTTINQCTGGIVNNKKLTVNNSQILNNAAHHHTYAVDHGIWMEIFSDYGGVIYNNKTANATIEKTIIKDNTVWVTYTYPNHYYGTIKNDGNMLITGCIFNNNTLNKWFEDEYIRYVGGLGTPNVENAGNLTLMYTYILNTPKYTIPSDANQYTQTPTGFLYNTGNASLNYNYFCIEPENLLWNAKANYYFLPAFENEYYPIKLNDNTNITLTLGLTNGTDYMDFNDWDKIFTPGFNVTVSTIDENGEYFNFTTFLKDKCTFNFNYTGIKAQYPIYANMFNYTYTAIVDIGKEFAEMEVTYNNITYNDGNNISFHIQVKGNLTTQPTGNITLTYNNKKITLNLTDGECNYTINETLKPNNYTMKIEYNGDDEYFRIIKQYYNFTVHKIPTNITISAPEVKIGENGKLTITITPSTAKMYGFLYYTTDRLHQVNADTQSQRVLTLKNFGVGVYNLTVIFEEDEYYLGGQASTLFIVSKYETQLNISCEDVPIGKSDTTLNITINPGDVRGDAIVEINGVNQSVYINKTTTEITLTDLAEGTYYVTVHYPGDSKYLPSNASASFSVARISSSLDAEILYNDDLTGNIIVKATPSDCTGEIGIYINNDERITQNLTDGTANIPVKFKRGTNYIYIHFNGNSYYSISSWNTTTYLEADAILSISSTILEENKTGYVAIILKDNGNNPYEYTDIEILFQNTTTTITTDENGTAYFPINTTSGTYTIKASYKNATLEQTVTVVKNRKPTLLTVSIPTISADDDLMVYATLKDAKGNGITTDIILEIEGKYYKIIINNGTGSRNLGQMKAKQYTYTATYPGNETLKTSVQNGTFQIKQNSYKITGNKNIKQYYGATKTYKIRLLNNNQPVQNAIITINLNKKTLKIKTDKNGYAKLKLKLKAGKYTIKASYKTKTVTNKITVKKTLITKNKTIKKGKTTTYQAKLLNKKGKALKNKKITFKINKKTYKAKTNKKGIAKIKIKINKGGKYTIKTSYKKQKNTNTIKVKN